MSGAHGSSVRPLLASVMSGALLAACNSSGPPSAVVGAMIAGPAIAHVVTQTDFTLESPVFVLDFWDGSAYSLFGGDEPAVAGAEPTSGLGEVSPLPGFTSLDDATRGSVDAALGSLGPAEYVASVEGAQDTSGDEHLGCFPLREGGTMITLGPPLQPFVPADEENAQLLVSVGLTHDCSGASWLLQLSWNGDAYETEVSRSVFWMV